MLKDTKKDCITYASMLGDYQSLSEQELLDGYCDAMDTDNKLNKNTYISALLLRFWYRIDKLYQQNRNLGLEREDFVFWIVEAIDYACKYRAWRTKDVNAKQAINQCIETIRMQHYYQANLDKHRANYNNISLDAPLNNSQSDDNESTLGDLLPTEDLVGMINENLTVEYLIQSYINKKKLVEAIILDNIAFKDSYKQIKTTNKHIDEETGETVKVTEYSHKFWPYKVVQGLGNLPVDYSKYFTSKYSVVAQEFEVALKSVKEANNQKLYKFLNATLKDLRKVMTA